MFPYVRKIHLQICTSTFIKKFVFIVLVPRSWAIVAGVAGVAGVAVQYIKRIFKERHTRFTMVPSKHLKNVKETFF